MQERSVDSLIELSELIDRGDFSCNENWNSSNETLGLTMPLDYQALSEEFAGGVYLNALCVYSPKSKRLNLASKHEALRQQMGDPSELVPNMGGLLLVGGAEDNHYLFYDTCSAWELSWRNMYMEEIERSCDGLVNLLLKWANGEKVPKIFREGIYEFGAPFFVSY